jgi:hypothetical protein
MDIARLKINGPSKGFACLKIIKKTGTLVILCTRVLLAAV